MTPESLLEQIGQSPWWRGKRAATAIAGLIGAARAAVLVLLRAEYGSLFVITASVAEAEKFQRELIVFGCPAVIFPAERADKKLIGERLKILAEKKAPVVLAPIRGVLVKTERASRTLKLKAKTKIDFEATLAGLVNFGYERREIVGERGEFSVRGGIIDIFPSNLDQPVRLELEGDEIFSLRQFEPFSQRSVGSLPTVVIFPAEELQEIPVSDRLTPDVKIVLAEEIDLTRMAERLQAEAAGYLKFDSIKAKGQISLSSFLAPGEEPVFSAPPDFRDRLEAIPPEALVISRHHGWLNGQLRGGFVFDGTTLLTDRELFGEELTPPRRERVAKEGVAEELLADLKIGDYVVHENYGIGKFLGLQRLEIEGVKQEYLLIEFADADKLYVPPPMIGLVEKYSGGREAHPRLSRLGSKSWLRTRAKVKQAVRDMTEELLELYAARNKLPGFAFPPDDLWQKELEATFPHEETPDQLKAIGAVKKDLESPRPTDRLICGDVGYGKTEVAIRAAAKVAAAGRQVALLAPTTILVEQHYNNFKERFKNFPFVVEMLSRFRSPAEQKETVRLLGAGGIDVVIGTHRLLSKDINFKDLGLLIIDEEQKFGVAHKERLKKLKQNVDVLTLTATPIPRTLYFSLSGIRELSMISTPPVDRSPVRTYVVPFSEKTIQEAIRRELDRGGQVFFVHNFVETIAGLAAKVKKLVPEARVAVAHGQLAEKELERTMFNFLERRFDILVCTAIIESGLDLPNVNTILIDRADRFGLSQLYQIRGRVGRSAVRAYAYLFYHPARSMTDQAVERLKAIQEFTALGSGYKLAMRDLEIRGSGNLLGAEQSGHIYEVGFDLYCELLAEAVRELKGEKITPPREVEIDLRVAASIPATYVSDDRQRIALYRRLNLVVNNEGLEELKKELTDRYGKMPPQLKTLLRIVKLKIKALQIGAKSIKEKDGRILFLDSRGQVLLDKLFIPDHD